MDSTTLGTPLVDDAVRDVNFFNGRLLTGRDLSREQDARRLSDRRLGQAVGPGIGWGLEVTPVAGTPAGRVTVSAGLGVSPSGQVLYLATDTAARLIPPVAGSTTSAGGDFGPCGPLSGAAYVAGDGLFLLTLAPATLAEGQAPVLALDSVNTRCNTDAWVEAVQLRMLRINGWENSVTASTDVANLRNRIAYAFFAPAGEAAAHGAPGNEAASGLLDQMFGQGLSRCDVPLAVVYMVGDAIVFIDAWSVRRRLAEDAAADSWSAWLGTRVQALAESRLLQFQQQVSAPSALLAAPASPTLAWLPPAGFLPAGTDWSRFFGSQAPQRSVPLAPEAARGVLATALHDDPIAVGSSTLVRVYEIGDGSGGGPLLFVRDSRNLHHAEQVWLDGTRAGLSGAADVQTAIDQLRAGTCLHVALRPGLPLAQMLAAIAKGSHATICFEPGNYTLGAPLTISGLGRVEIHGTGAVLKSTKSEAALVVTECQSLSVDGLAFEGTTTGAGKSADGTGLGGALTVVDTLDVRIERIIARSGAFETLAASTIAVRMSKPAGAGKPQLQMQVRISDCEVLVGNAQCGILCVNAELAHISGNRVRAVSIGRALQRGIVVAGERAGQVHVERNVVRDAVEGIAVGVSTAQAKEVSPLQAERVIVAHNHVELLLDQASERANRFGLFVGNAVSLLLSGNEVYADPKAAAGLGLHGLRLDGLYGAQVLVRDNRFVGPAVAMRFRAISSELKPVLWLFEGNVGEDLSTDLFSIDEFAGKLVVMRDNVRVS